MDPDAALNWVREVANRVHKHYGMSTLASELADAVTELDEWLTKGGFPPKDWDQYVKNNTITGRVTGSVVQAGNVEGGVYL